MSLLHLIAFQNGIYFLDIRNSIAFNTHSFELSCKTGKFANESLHRLIYHTSMALHIILSFKSFRYNRKQVYAICNKRFVFLMKIIQGVFRTTTWPNKVIYFLKHFFTIQPASLMDGFKGWFFSCSAGLLFKLYSFPSTDDTRNLIFESWQRENTKLLTHLYELKNLQDVQGFKKMN